MAKKHSEAMKKAWAKRKAQESNSTIDDYADGYIDGVVDTTDKHRREQK